MESTAQSCRREIFGHDMLLRLSVTRVVFHYGIESDNVLDILISRINLGYANNNGSSDRHVVVNP